MKFLSINFTVICTHFRDFKMLKIFFQKIECLIWSQDLLIIDREVTLDLGVVVSESQDRTALARDDACVHARRSVLSDDALDELQFVHGAHVVHFLLGEGATVLLLQCVQVLDVGKYYVLRDKQESS